MGKLVKFDYFDIWKSMLDITLNEEFSTIQSKEIETHTFTFYTSVSVMSSSKIEGEKLEIDSYVKHKLLKIEYLPELTEKPNDLYNAYLFAQKNRLTKPNFAKAHKLVAAHLLPQQQQGELRQTEMVVMEHNTGRIQYEACPCNYVNKYFNILWDEIDELLQKQLSINEIFYYAAFIHLVFVNIHPYTDGNGRIARLLEKWFLSEKLGEKCWFIQSEKYYYQNIENYYRNLARLGMFFDELDYEKSIPFLLMLPQSINYKQSK